MGGSLLVEHILEILKVDPRGRKLSDFPIFIETGTHRGDTILAVATQFQSCYTIELHPGYFNYSRWRTSHLKNVLCIEGDSISELPNLCQSETNNPIIFYLDAHYSSCDTAKSFVDVPLLLELKEIAKRDLDDLIIVDDYRMFGTNITEDWSPITEKSILDALEGRVDHHIVSQDRFVIFLNNRK